MNPTANVLPGGCHCGNLAIAFESRVPPEETELRACGCSFCRKHGARSVSDPQGSVRIVVRDPRRLLRYRFGLRTADFLVCSRCGVYAAAVATIAGRSYATVNANALDDAKRFVREAVPRSYEGESAEQRAARRRERWTPVAELVEGGG